MASPTNGNLLVVHGGGTTAVLNASLYGVLREASRYTQVGEFYGARSGTAGLLDGDLIDLRRQPAATIEALLETPGSVLGSSRRPLEDEDYDRMVEQLRRRNIRYVFFTGGNGTMLGAGRLARGVRERGWDARVIGIPKTVDNDLLRTDHTPGYGSSARYLAISALELGLDNEALPFPICILETIGRNVGWLAAATILAARHPEEGPQLVYVPEIPFRAEQFLADVEDVYRRKGRAFIAVCEAVKDEHGEPVFYSSSDSDRDGFGRPLPGNVAVELVRLIGRELKLRVRNDKPGLCARMSMAHISTVDRDEARQCGEVAVRHAMLGISGMMVTLERACHSPYRCHFGLAPLDEIGNREKIMPREFMNEAGNYPTQAFIDYARPLAGGDFPRYARL